MKKNNNIRQIVNELAPLTTLSASEVEDVKIAIEREVRKIIAETKKNAADAAVALNCVDTSEGAREIRQAITNA